MQLELVQLLWVPKAEVSVSLAQGRLLRLIPIRVSLSKPILRELKIKGENKMNINLTNEQREMLETYDIEITEDASELLLDLDAKITENWIY